VSGFADRTAELAPVRAALRWYPPDVERYVLAAGWQRLSQEMPMVGRTVGDAVSQALLADITDPDVTRLPAMIGSIEQWARSVDVLSSPARRTALRAAYRAWADAG